MKRITATYVKELSGWKGDARLYRLSRAVTYQVLPTAQNSPRHKATTKHVVVSSVMAFGFPEVYIFPAHKDGTPINVLEMYGSRKGTLVHEVALSDAGWDIT